MRVDNCIRELGISERSVPNKEHNKINEVILLFIPQRKGNKDNEGVDEEPRGMLVDNRFDDVRG